MNAPAIVPKTPRRKAREYLAECFAALRRTDDRFAGLWSDPTMHNERRALLVLAGQSVAYVGVDWERIPEDVRNAIKRKAVETHAALGRVLAWEPERVTAVRSAA